MRITSAGKVGIGTDNPGQHLTIKRTGGQTQVSIKISDNTNESGAIYFGDTASTNRGVVLYDHGQEQFASLCYKRQRADAYFLSVVLFDNQSNRISPAYHWRH